MARRTKSNPVLGRTVERSIRSDGGTMVRSDGGTVRRSDGGNLTRLLQLDEVEIDEFNKTIFFAD